jgi:UbiD family decarboxylase
MEPVPPAEVPCPGYYLDGAPEDIPIPTYYEGDGGPYITSGIFHTTYREKGNLSFHRMMYLGDGRFAIRIVPRHLNTLMKEAKDDGGELKVAVSIGCDIASLIAASCTMEYGMDEFGIASSLMRIATGSPLSVFRPDGEGPLAPLGAEIVLVGRITEEIVPEGPFIDITGTRDLSGMGGQPVFVTDRVLVRPGAIMHVLLPGGLEHFLLMGLPKEPSILQSVRKVVPLVHAVRLTEGGCSWLHGIVSITQQRPGDARNAILASFSGHPSMKRVIVVDDDIDIFDDRAVEWAVATRFQAHRDLVLISGARGSTLDPSLDPDGTTSKYGLDATMPIKDQEGFRRVSI